MIGGLADILSVVDYGFVQILSVATTSANWHCLGVLRDQADVMGRIGRRDVQIPLFTGRPANFHLHVPVYVRRPSLGSLDRGNPLLRGRSQAVNRR